jgi:integrase/recombinase XerD
LEQYCARDLAEGTVERTTRILTDFGQWLKRCRPRPNLEEVGADLLVRYIESRKSFRSKATVYGTLSVLRGMGDFLVRECVWRNNPLRWMRGPKVTPYSRAVRRIDGSEMEELWRAATRSRGVYAQHLWVTIVALLYGTGLRRGELERLNVDSFDRVEGTLRIDGRKTGRERCVPIPELLYRALDVYLPQRQNLLDRVAVFDQPALLVNRYGRRLTSQAISVGIHRIAERAQLPVVNLHQFRHSCASDLLEAGVHLAEVQRILGHQVIATTVRYVHIADPQRRVAIGLHPINDWLTQEAS